MNEQQMLCMMVLHIIIVLIVMAAGFPDWTVSLVVQLHSLWDLEIEIVI